MTCMMSKVVILTGFGVNNLSILCRIYTDVPVSWVGLNTLQLATKCPFYIGFSNAQQ